MFIRKVVTNPSLRACGSIVVGSPSFAQRKVFASPVAASATSTITADSADRHTQPRIFVTWRLALVRAQVSREQFPRQRPAVPQGPGSAGGVVLVLRAWPGMS